MIIQLDPEKFKNAEDIHGEGHEILVKKAFNSKMMEIFQGSNIEEILEQMFTYFKTQIENPALLKSGFTLDGTMHLEISFHQLQLTRGSSYITLSTWLASKKAVINPRMRKMKSALNGLYSQRYTMKRLAHIQRGYQSWNPTQISTIGKL